MPTKGKQIQHNKLYNMYVNPTSHFSVNVLTGEVQDDNIVYQSPIIPHSPEDFDKLHHHPAKRCGVLGDRRTSRIDTSARKKENLWNNIYRVLRQFELPNSLIETVFQIATKIREKEPRISFSSSSQVMALLELLRVYTDLIPVQLSVRIRRIVIEKYCRNKRDCDKDFAKKKREIQPILSQVVELKVDYEREMSVLVEELESHGIPVRLFINDIKRLIRLIKPYVSGKKPESVAAYAIYVVLAKKLGEDLAKTARKILGVTDTVIKSINELLAKNGIRIEDYLESKRTGVSITL